MQLDKNLLQIKKPILFSQIMRKYVNDSDAMSTIKLSYTIVMQYLLIVAMKIFLFLSFCTFCIRLCSILCDVIFYNLSKQRRSTYHFSLVGFDKMVFSSIQRATELVGVDLMEVTSMKAIDPHDLKCMLNLHASPGHYPLQDILQHPIRTYEIFHGAI